MTAASPAKAPPLVGPFRLGVDVVVMAVLTIASVMAFSASQVSAAGWLGRLVVPGRMLILLLIATLLLRQSGQGWRDVGFARPKRLWLTLVLALGGYLASYLLVGLVVALLFPVLHLSRPGIGPLGHVRGNLGEYLYWMIPVTWASAAFGEEMLFRGFFFTRLLRMFPASRLAVAGAVLAQAILFGSLHLYLGMSGAIVAGVMGIVLASVYLFGGRNLWASIILHGLIDSTSITVVYLGLAKV
ncbi:CPBP family intramembrane glutamic endopeptidase [Phenylobacterium sp.]|uniref:CPBP family intramembrane glutamic endopeptidase n=1 Tax=Phenylobacterium sp. TaxID=1871053 RepID=UPI002DF5EDAB|nr:CPBP family intramembrane glutamic endopeptidase [Phenylobacterium sp.]